MYEEFLERCLQKMPDDIDKREGSIVYTLLAPLCYELANIYFEMSNFLELSFLGTSYGDYLDKIGVLYNVERFSEVLNEKTAKIVTTDDILGLTFYVGTYNFVVTENLGDDLYILQASEFSLEYNSIVGELYCALNSQEITEAYIMDNITLAEEAEDDESYRVRILEKITTKPYGGNIADYEEKVLDVSGVSYAKVFTGTDDAPGYVNIVVAGVDKIPVSDDIITNVNELFNGTESTEGVAPIGHIVIAKTTSYVDLDISVAISTAQNFDSVKEAITTRITEYISGLSFESDIVSINKILAQVFLDDDIIDASNLTLNGLNENYILEKTLENYEIARVVNISVEQI